MIIVESFSAARALHSGLVGLVPTMGFLHEGHLSLAREARRDTDTVVMSLFVNPLQFGAGEDLSAYPRDRERDAALAESVGVDVLFAPPLDEMYPEPPATEVGVPALSESLEGVFRPGHFTGVATVVAKLFAGLRPDRAYFGRKDAQQLAVIRRLAADLSFPVFIVGCPIVREPDGLALSSRNVFLSADDREAATAISRGLMDAADAVEAGERSARALESLVASAIGDSPHIQLDYVALADSRNVLLLSDLDRPAFLAVAATVGTTRLIDNVHFDPVGDTFVADRGTRIERSSVLYREEKP